MKTSALSFIKLIAAVLLAYMVYEGYLRYASRPADQPVAENAASNTQKNTASSQEETVELTTEQLKAVKIAPVPTYRFHTIKEEAGSVAFHDKDTRGAEKSKFVVANILESDSPWIHAGQAVSVHALAYPDKAFDGKVSVVGVSIYDSSGNPAIDPNTHRIAVRCEVKDPKNMLYPGMLVTVAIETGKPVDSLTLPENGVVREGDGTMSAWVATDRQHFMRRIVMTGIRQDGYVQVLNGLQSGDQAVTDGAVFLSNMLYALPAE